MWAMRDFPLGTCGDVEDRFTAIWDGLGGPRGVLLAAERRDAETNRLLLKLPDETYLASFLGFTPIVASRLPKRAVHVAGHVDEFESHFDYGSPI